MTAAVLTINSEDRTPVSEWDATWEERIDGVGTATVTIQDRDPASGVEYGRGTNVRDGDPTPTLSKVSSGWRDIVQISVGGFMLFSGEVTDTVLNLPASFPWRRWQLTAADFNTVLDLRLVGVPDGATWETIDGGETHEAIDPNAHGLSRDGTTLQALFDNYAGLPRFDPLDPDSPPDFDTTTYVRNWIPRNVMIDRATGETRLRWTHTTLRSAIDEMRGLAGFPLFCWIDPDLAVHWEAVRDWTTITSGTLIAPQHPTGRQAPAVITDTDPNGTTSVGGRELSVQYDATYMPQIVYVNGVTDFIYNGGSTIFQGTGWRKNPLTGLHTQSHKLVHLRQFMVDAETVTDAEKTSVALAYTRYGKRARIRGSVKVGTPTEAVDGWRVGQLVTIIDARLPPGLNGKAFPIQRVKGELKAGQNFRVYTIEFGDYPIARFSQKYRTAPQRLQTSRLPAKEHKIYMPTVHLRPSTSYTITSQMVDRSSKPVRRGGIPVVWSLTVKDRAGVEVSTGSISAITSVTDDHGRTKATLTTGAATDLHYHASCKTAAQ